MRDLDTASRVIFLIPVFLLLLKRPIKTCVLSYSIPLGGIIAVCIALYDKFILNLNPDQNPRIMHIQGGDISMSLGIFSLMIALYAHHKKDVKLTTLSVIGGLCGIVGSLLSTARGGWVALPVLLVVILYIYRQSLSKRFFLTFFGIIVIASIGISQMPNNRIMERIDVAQKDIQLYLDNHDGNTSLGARFEMWKSALEMAKEKPLFGWGIQGATEKRKQETKEKIATGNIGQFTHAHNQYLDDLSKRGIVGLLALLAVLFIPLRAFMKKLNNTNDEIKLIATLGVAHILSVMIYGLSQGFLVHNSGTIFYFFLTIVFYAAIRTHQKAE
ncbi:O-antigen ligase [uncultured Haemophilus sp.]|uniref:O-antigen ligase family protein n=1 Tax=uncultured Haemophilus sp. TaxID=237779 RepID=UPI00258CB90F|nr:O-antigen ligase [uncultured Haemophilus sp.]